MKTQLMWMNINGDAMTSEKRLGGGEGRRHDVKRGRGWKDEGGWERERSLHF